MKNQQSPRRHLFLYLAVRLNELLDDRSNRHLVARVLFSFMAIAGLIALGVGHAAQALFDLDDRQAMWVMAGTLAIPALCAATYYGLKSD